MAVSAECSFLCGVGCFPLSISVCLHLTATHDPKGLQKQLTILMIVFLRLILRIKRDLKVEMIINQTTAENFQFQSAFLNYTSVTLKNSVRRICLQERIYLYSHQFSKKPLKRIHSYSGELLHFNISGKFCTSFLQGYKTKEDDMV